MTMNRNEHLGQTALLAGLLLIYTPARAAAPTTWHVHNNGDIGAIGSGDLREAVGRAGAGDTIVFDGVVRGTITLGSALPPIANDLTINGPGPTQLSLECASERVFHLVGGHVTITDLRIVGHFTGGNGPDGTSVNSPDGGPAQPQCGGQGGGGGGGIFDESPQSLTVSNCLFDHCMAKGGNGGNAFVPLTESLQVRGNGGAGACISGGAIDQTAGDLCLVNCAFVSNSGIGGTGGTGHDGGRGGAGGNAEGGAVVCEYTSTRLALINCTFYDNKAIGGQGMVGSDGWIGDGAQPGGDGGPGGDASGGGIYIQQGVIVPGPDARGVDSCTVVGNWCYPDWGGAGGHGVNFGGEGLKGAPGTGYGCGLYWTDLQVLCVANAIIANNYGSSGSTIKGRDVYVENRANPITSLGYNFIGWLDADGGTGWGPTGWPTPTDLSGGAAVGSLDPQLGPLQYNDGGQTPTMAPELCSPVVDTGADVWGNGMDQIGQSRPLDLHRYPLPPVGPTNDRADRGAFEVQFIPPEPLLSLSRSGGSITITWPASTSPCFVLEQTLDLQTPVWTPTPGVIPSGGVYIVTVGPPLAGNMFYRLQLVW